MLITARRGLVCSPEDGYDYVPESVRSNPDLAARANSDVGRHATYGALLTLAPIGYAVWMLVRDEVGETPTSVLVAAAVYAAVIGMVILLPFERMKNW